MSVGLILGESATNEPEYVNMLRNTLLLHFVTRDIYVPYITPRTDHPPPTMVAYTAAVAAMAKYAFPAMFVKGEYMRLFREVMYAVDNSRITKKAGEDDGDEDEGFFGAARAYASAYVNPPQSIQNDFIHCYPPEETLVCVAQDY